MKIPTKFKLMGQTIDVKFDPESVFNEDAYGLADFNHNRIVLQSNINGVPRTEEQLGHTFCHELVHHIFNSCGEKDLRKDERIVDIVSGLLFQAFETMEYEDERKNNKLADKSN